MAQVPGLYAGDEPGQRHCAPLDGPAQELPAQVIDMKQGLDAYEERARSELGMIREDETFYLIVPGAEPR